LQKALDAHGADWVRKMDAAKRAMFRPERLIELIPDRQAQFLLAASEPYREGQKVINGVYFKPEHAEAMLKSIAAAQAEALNVRPPLKDLQHEARDDDHGCRRITGGNAGVRPGSAREKISACRKPLGASGLS